MKKSIFGFFLALILIQACNKDGAQIPNCYNCNFTCLEINETDAITNNCINNWECLFKVTSMSKVDVSDNQGLSNGDKIVFQMINSNQGELVLADAQITNILVFQIDESQNSFSVNDNELEEMQTHFRRKCFCVESEFKAITSGCMQGEKQSDGTWFVQGNLIVPYSNINAEVKFDAQFVN